MNTLCKLLLALACLGGSIALLLQKSAPAKCAALFLIVLAVIIGAQAFELECGNVVVYSLEGCPWCEKAKARLTDSKIPFETVDYSRGMKNPPAMPDGSVPTRFPQIWVGSKNMGGYDGMDSWVTTFTSQCAGAPRARAQCEM